MRKYYDSILHSASDLNAYLGCTHATALSYRKLLDPGALPDPAGNDEQAALIARAGDAHERAYLSELERRGPVTIINDSGSLVQRVAKTREAMRAGAPLIYQAAFLDEPWHGFADFLRRTEEPSALGPWSYEPVDTKLALSPRPKHLIQLALYADLIESEQACAPRKLHLVLGNGGEQSFAAHDFKQSLSVAKTRYLDFVSGGANGTLPEPCSSCSLCGWREVCDAEWERTDDLSRVASLTRGQAKKLRASGVSTLTQLAQANAGLQIPRLAPVTFEKLRSQASLQSRRGTKPLFELLPIERDRGFLRLPQPDPADLFFDLEGDPLHEGGLEYLWGVHYRDGGAPAFAHHWAHDRTAERAAFEAVVDWFTAHMAAHPNAHIYHYAAYEVTVLRRLSTEFASREEEVDALLRAEKLVDLYAVARAAVRTSERDMSLKTLERFFAPEREENVKAAGESIVHYHRWRESGDAHLLRGILAYNRVDCENTEGLRDWLLSIRPMQLPWWQKKADPPTERQMAAMGEREAMRSAARERIAASTCLENSTKELLAQLVDFHKRAKKPAQWAVYDRCNTEPDELCADLESIGRICPSGKDWVRREKRSMVARYVFPAQETKLKPGDDVLHAPTQMKLGPLFALNSEDRFVEVKRQLKSGEEFPQTGSIIAGWPLDDTVIESGLWRTAMSLASGSGSQAAIDLIERNGPRLKNWPGGELVRPGEDLVTAAAGRVLALDNGTLFIQGPPGTGKTHTSAEIILALVQAGKRVGVSSNSHKAINNLLLKLEDLACARGITFNGVKKVSGRDPDTYLNGRLIDDTEDNEYVEAGGWNVIGGTAYLFARPEMEGSVDYLFVDEAGQVSLANLLAMAGATSNLVLVGDQMQLAQPVQGAHPGQSGSSALDYLLQGHATIAPDRGILLDTSWRMHPAVCGFISDAIYDGRLKAHPDCARQQLILPRDAHGALKSAGISLVAVTHEGCGQSSEEEAEKVRELLAALENVTFVDRLGSQRPLTLKDILVVAPYNAQVNLLQRRLPAGARVGTVDKFQGQEGEVVITSLATSSPEDLPRHVDFFYSKNRLNVAISRARCLALLVMNPRLLELNAGTVEDLRLLNSLAWAHSYAALPQVPRAP